jgi:hypothetical protein
MPVYTALVVALLLPAAAFAQGAPGKPAPAQRPAEEVIVTQSASGDELRGRLVELSPTTLAMLVNGQRVELPLESVLRIDARGDSVKNGAIIGAAVMGGWCAIVCGQALGGGGQYGFAVVTNAGFGALIGAGIDALHKGRTTIYSKPAAVAVAPAGRGARVQFKLRF